MHLIEALAPEIDRADQIERRLDAPRERLDSERWMRNAKFADDPMLDATQRLCWLLEVQKMPKACAPLRLARRRKQAVKPTPRR